MSDPVANDVSAADQWAMACDSAHSFAASLARRIPPQFAQLITGEARKFCERNSPTSQIEIDRLRRRFAAMTEKIMSIAEAAGWARRHPDVAAEIYELAKALDEQVPQDESAHGECMNMTIEFSRLCVFNSTKRRIAGFDRSHTQTG